MEKGGEVKLIGMWASPFVLRARIALNLKHVPYEIIEENIPFSKSQLLLDSNPVHKKVPVLLHHGKSICESLIIMEYIDEVWASTGTPILPLDPYDRATARFWAAFVDEKVFAPMKMTMTAEPEELKTVISSILMGLELLEEAMEKCSKGGRFFGGETIGFLDLALGSLVGWLKVLGKRFGLEFLDPDKTPKLALWAESFSEADAVKDVMPGTDKLVEFGTTILAALTAAASTPAPSSS